MKLDNPKLKELRFSPNGMLVINKNYYELDGPCLECGGVYLRRKEKAGTQKYCDSSCSQKNLRKNGKVPDWNRGDGAKVNKIKRLMDEMSEVWPLDSKVLWFDICSALEIKTKVDIVVEYIRRDGKHKYMTVAKMLGVLDALVDVVEMKHEIIMDNLAPRAPGSFVLQGIDI